MRRDHHPDVPRATRFACAVLAAIAVVSCGRDTTSTQSAGRVELPARFGFGQPAAPAQLAALDIDANASGAGLPAGRGTYEQGAAIYAQKCASCHGAKGEGIAPTYPQLIGVEPRDSFPFGKDAKIPKTVGNYWPYATTLYDYVHRAMPLTAPGSLQPDEVYGVVAFLLAENGIVPRTAVMDAASLPKVVMPARKHFVPDDRRGGAVFR
jgi:cytochrome c